MDPSEPKPQGQCRLFGTLGGCHYGARCKYSHITTDASFLQNTRNGAEDTQSSLHLSRQGQIGQDQDESYRTWRRLISKATKNKPSSFGNRLPQLFQTAYTIAQGNLDTLQRMITELAADQVVIAVRELIDEHILFCSTDADRITLWYSCIKPFFKMLTEPRVVQSVILEVHTGTIYSVILGYNAARLEVLFKFLINLAAKWQGDDVSKIQFLELCTAILVKALDRNTQALDSEIVPRLIGQLRDFIDGLDQNHRSFWSLQATRHLDYIERRFDHVKGVAQDAAPNLQLSDYATFTVLGDGPGTLSTEGPRHDNDSKDITKIRILPTMSELMSTREDYRPLHDSSSLHLRGIQGLIDRHFRLLREDTVGQLKKCIGEELRILENYQDEPISNIQSNIRKYSYNIVDIVDVTCTRRLGLEFHLKLEQPPLASKLASKAREDWWSMSKRLETGALVCFLERNTAVFCVVSESTVRPKINPLHRVTKKGSCTGASVDKHNLHSDKDFAYVSLSLAEPSDADLRVLLRAFQSKQSTQRSLVEFPGVLVPSFKPTLRALQHIYKTLDLPFINLLAPISDGPVQATIPPPLYTTKPGFVFNLKCITSDEDDLLFSPQNTPNPRELCSRSSLDEGQALAVLNALKRSLALIQGPPGTGKSYTGEAIVKVLLANKEQAKIGPIICVCRTNHALDQLLENLWHGGVKQIIRIGSRSKSSILQQVNLRKIAQRVEHTKSEKKTEWMYGSALSEVEAELKAFITGLQTLVISEKAKEYVKTKATSFYDAIFDTEQDEWAVATHEDESTYFRRWIDAGIISDSQAREIDILENQDPMSLSQQERSLVCKEWASIVVTELENEFISLHNVHQRAKKRYDKIFGEMDLRVLGDADIIGVTTTGLAKNLEMLRKLDTKVLLCEEAGEVLESHILTALLPSVEHAILVGDHLQLRPHIGNYELSVVNPNGERYALDVSLFERLVRPTRPTDLRLPFDMLEIQRRMHPSISSLIIDTLYHDLKDSGEVGDYPEVVGMRRRLYWFDHEEPETTPDPDHPTDTSRTNDFEVEMVCAFVSHLVRQGVYLHDDIAVITPYLGQLHKLSNRLQESFEVVVEDQDLTDLHSEGFDVGPKVYERDLESCLRLATVDNFQGEEAKIVVVSLVRSNEDRQCGFMKTTNRINVLLSRAKHGMYIFGNSTTYDKVEMWSQVIDMLKESENIGIRLPLQCPRHKDTLIEVSNLNDFTRLSPEAGCNAQCLQILECGHTCSSKCHAAPLHKAAKCQKQCSLLKEECGHGCPNPCGEPCEENCSTILEGEKLSLPCGHFLISPTCWQTMVPGKIECRQRVKRPIPGCNHGVEVPCNEDIASNDITCLARCDFPLSCGHTCPGVCKNCKIREGDRVVKELHQQCMSICARRYNNCNHVCDQPCHPGEECPPCEKACEVQCEHRRCHKKCTERCPPCKQERCSSGCVHRSCTMPCAAPCDWIPCSKRCREVLQRCGHQCPSLCGEVCPDAEYCQICASEDIKSTVVDTVKLREYRDVDLDEDPCIFPDCGHMMTISSMDVELDMSDYYELSFDSSIVAIKPLPKPLSSTTIKACPKCRGSLRNISRYGRLVRQSLLDESTKKFISWSHAEAIMLERYLIREKQRLENPENAHAVNSKQLRKVFGKAGNLKMGIDQWDHVMAIFKQFEDRYSRIVSLHFDIFSRMDRIMDEERPYNEVFGLVEKALRAKGVTDKTKLDSSRVYTHGELMARATLFRSYLVILSDFLQLRNKAPGSSRTIHFGLAAQIEECEKLIKLAKTTGYVVQEAEGHIFFAKLIALVQQVGNPEERVDQERVSVSHDMVTEAKDHISEAETIVREYPSATHLRKELDAVKNMLIHGVFYRGMLAQEQHAIYRAMDRKFTPAGHWYTCVRGHPFTAVDSEVPMEEAKCPHCGTPVGEIDDKIVFGV
ncbi:P-loop containing nucleoside triphosphate hydrolase protein [Annulohypoxylon bovei var. microspora]|nr:P-loop containing nucleoside triphosphate hydrolase protein [Annulohypoxylon bovei var. microspora]